MDRLESLTGQARLIELKKKMEEMKRQNEADKRKLQAILESHEFELDNRQFLGAEPPSSANGRAPSPAMIGGSRGRDPLAAVAAARPLHASSPEQPRVGGSPPVLPLSSSAPSPSGAFLRPAPARTDSGYRLKPGEAAAVRSPSPMASPLSSSGSGTPSPLSSSGGAPPSSSAPPAESEEDTAAKLKKRSNIILEIINTEKDYVTDLQIVKDVYLRHLDRDEVLNKNQMNDVFSNLEQLLEVNNELYRCFEERRNAASDPANVQLGEAFLEKADLLKSYTPYFINHPTAEAVVREQAESNKVFADFLNHQQFNNARTRGLTIFMFLIKPIQRICKYPLLLRELIKYTPQSHPDYPNLLGAAQKIEELVTFLNEKKRDKEALQKVAEIANSIDNMETPIVNPTRRFQMEANLSLVKGTKIKKRTVFLFNDLVVFAKMKPTPKAGGPPRYTFKGMMMMSNVRVLDIADRPGYCYLLGVCPKDSEAQQNFMCSSIDEKQTWLAALKKIVREFQMKEVAERKGTLLPGPMAAVAARKATDSPLTRSGKKL